MGSSNTLKRVYKKGKERIFSWACSNMASDDFKLKIDDLDEIKGRNLLLQRW